MKPIIAVVSDTKVDGVHLYHRVGNKYIQALLDLTDALPLMLPSMEDPMDVNAILGTVDGILFTGAYANIQREIYGLNAAPKSEIQDFLRDKNTLPLLRAAVKAGVPIFGICRGFQEMNVAFGGTLHPRLHEIEGRMDHREGDDDPIEIQYGPAHNMTVQAGGLFGQILDDQVFEVNSVHGQGVNQLGEELMVEALADDGTIEAISVKNAKAFALAVQWHPEWQAAQNKQSTQMFSAFNVAVQKHYNTKK